MANLFIYFMLHSSRKGSHCLFRIILIYSFFSLRWVFCWITLLPIYMCKTGNNRVTPDELTKNAIHFKNWDWNNFHISIAVTCNDAHYETSNKNHVVIVLNSPDVPWHIRVRVLMKQDINNQNSIPFLNNWENKKRNYEKPVDGNVWQIMYIT